jgi:DNA-binding LacI/PurR family transcriptional regulator
VQERLEGYHRALDESSGKPAILLGPNVPDTLPLQQFAHDAVRQYLLAGGELDGLFAVSDDGAIGALGALIQAGLSVPGDVSVIGFGDEGMGAYISPSLTTIRAPLQQVGAAAVELLFRRLRRENVEPPPQRLRLEPGLVVRQSCGGAERRTTEL